MRRNSPHTKDDDSTPVRGLNDDEGGRSGQISQNTNTKDKGTANPSVSYYETFELLPIPPP